MLQHRFARVIGAGLTTGLVDGAWACVLSAGFYGSTIRQLWEGVARVATGRPSMLTGIAVHFGVAFFWSFVFFAIVSAVAPVRGALRSWRGVFAVSAIYGPLVWSVMSLAVIPFMTGRAPNVTHRWWIQLAGHVFFVGLPIVSWFRQPSSDVSASG